MSSKLSKVIKFLVVGNIFVILNWALILNAAPLSGKEILGFEISILAQVVFGIFFYSLWSRRAQVKEAAQVLPSAQGAEACGD